MTNKTIEIIKNKLKDSILEKDKLLLKIEVYEDLLNELLDIDTTIEKQHNNLFAIEEQIKITPKIKTPKTILLSEKICNIISSNILKGRTFNHLKEIKEFLSIKHNINITYEELKLHLNSDGRIFFNRDKQKWSIKKQDCLSLRDVVFLIIKELENGNKFSSVGKILEYLNKEHNVVIKRYILTNYLSFIEGLKFKYGLGWYLDKEELF